MATPPIYSDVFDRLERDPVRYVVVSGVAVVLHGHVRPIADLDIVIDRSPDEAQRAMLTLAACGFVPGIPLPLGVLTVLRMFDRLNREVDVFVRYHIPFEELLLASAMVHVGDNIEPYRSRPASPGGIQCQFSAKVAGAPLGMAQPLFTCRNGAQDFSGKTPTSSLVWVIILWARLPSFREWK